MITNQHADGHASSATPTTNRAHIHYPVAHEEWKEELEQRHELFGTGSGYWCYVRPGTYAIGQGQDQADVTLPAFWITRYTITVAQFEPFVAEGYSDSSKRWWPPNGWEWKQRSNRMQPWLWNDAAYHKPDQPVIGISWYEAVTFAHWLTWHLLHVLPEGYIIHVPTEAEWEAAAAFDVDMQRCMYPWGNEEPTPNHAVYDQSGLDQPAAIGTCSQGASACGAHDMAGNVWEWGASSFTAYPAGSATRLDDFLSSEWDVPLRGGAWWDHKMFLSCESRDMYPPDFHTYVFGFRLVLGPA